MEWLALFAVLFVLAVPLYGQMFPHPGPGSQHVSTPPPTGNCGAIGSYPSLTIGNQNACGDVSDGRPAAPSSPTIITSCNPTITAGNKYQLGADLNCGATNIAITVNGPGTVLDINGHTVTGRVNVNTDTNGVHVYSSQPGDLITCSSDVSTQPCLSFNSSSSSFTSLFRLDHLTVQNTANSTSSARAVFGDFSSINSGTLTGTPNSQFDHITVVSATGLSSTRIIDIMAQATAGANKAYPVFFNNLVTCVTNAAACQGIEAYGVWDAKIYNNAGINQLNSPSSTETPRAFFCDQTRGCAIYNNYCDTQDGRCVRMRGTTNTDDINAVYNNIADNVVAGTNPNHVGAFHLGDPDSGTEAENLTVYNNIINFKSGLVGMSRSATAISVQDNTVNCVGCSGTQGFYYLRYIGAASSANLWRNNLTSLSGPQSLCDASTTSSVCQSGTATGCTVNNSVCAAFPTPPANAKTFSNLNVASGNPGTWTICNANNSCAAGTPSGIGSATVTPGTPLTFTNVTGSGSPSGWNTLLYRHMGASFLSDDGTRTIAIGSIQNAIYDVVITPTFTTGQIVGYEFDPDIFVDSGGTGNWTAKVSIACYTSDNKWHLYNQAIQSWVATTYPCTMSTSGSGTTNELKYYVTYDWTNHQYTYQNVVFNGVTVFGPANAVTYGMWNHDSGNELNFEVQIDNHSSPTTASGTYVINASVW